MKTERAAKPPRVLITRPAGQHANFEQQCQALRFETCLLPCIAIEPVELQVEQLQQQRDTHEIVLFTSTNAARFAHRAAPLPWPDMQVHAIGAATAHYLQASGQKLAMTPRQPFTSEAYLAKMQERTESTLLIIKGVGGRDLIPNRLRSAGWTVNCVDVYQRLPTQFSPVQIDSLFTDTPPDVICITSDEILTNLWQLCHEYREALCNLPLIVNSSRCAVHARQLGFKIPALVAQPAGDIGQIICLQNWATRYYR